MVEEKLIVYRTDDGWRYCVGQRDDGNYPSHEDARDCGIAWLATLAEEKEERRSYRDHVAYRPIAVETIQHEVARYFDVRLHELRGPRRHQAVAHPRMIAMYLTRKLAAMSFPAIGRSFGGKDHTTVISAVRKIDRLRLSDPTVRSQVDAIEKYLTDEHSNRTDAA